jgi:diguanylate cyclase (GGDEF)-like protein
LDGTTVEVEAAASPIVLNGQPAALVTVRDITDRRMQEQKISRLSRIQAVLSGINSAIVRIRDRQELFKEACRIAVEHGGFGIGWIAILDPQSGTLVPVAQAGLPMDLGAKGGASDRAVGLAPWGTAAVALREKRPAFDNDIERGLAEMQSKFGPDTLSVRRAAIGLGAKSVIVLPLYVEGKPFGILTLYAPERNFFDDEEIKLLSELAGDISFGLEFIAKDEKVDYLAYYDVLTGLANRSLFLERVAQYMRSAASGGQKVALFLFDLERFKNINDSLGRPAGDALLKLVAEWLTHNLGDANLFARVDADHFAIVLPEVKQDGDVARLVESTVKSFMEHPFRLNDAVLRIAAKVGGALFPDDGMDAETLFRNAEVALKKAKASGERYLFYTQKMTETVARTLTLENQLRQALDKDEFVLHYQPKVNLVSGKLTGAEALIRWTDPRTGLVPPGRFIPVLEQTGLIYEVGRWALRQAIEDYLRWRAAGLAAVRIAVNVSPLQLRKRGFIGEISKAIGIDPRSPAGLELELTESLIMEDVKHSVATLRAIRDLGVTVAIDDFGTGFSSLSYLSRLPLDTLKIDRAFVADLGQDAEAKAIVAAVLTMARALGLRVVAEGVETPAQRDLLVQMGCDELQGYLFAKPMSARAIVLWAMDAPASLAQTFSPSLFKDTAVTGSAPTEIMPSRPARLA